MAYTPWDVYVDTMPIPTTIEELQQALQIKYNTDWKTITDTITGFGGDPTNFEELADLAGLKSANSIDGTYTYWYYEDQLGSFTANYNPTISTNASTTRTAVKTPINTTVDSSTGKVSTTLLPKSGSFAQNAAYVLGEIGQATTAASIGIWLGKTIDSTLYNANPDFWDAAGMSSLNPETWSSITSGDTSLGATLFNWVFGIDPDTGNMQGYADAEAVAYMAYWLKMQGVFNPPDTTIEIKTDEQPFNITILNPSPILVTPAFYGKYNLDTVAGIHAVEVTQNTTPVYVFGVLQGSSNPNARNAYISLWHISKEPFTVRSNFNSRLSELNNYSSYTNTVYHGSESYTYSYLQMTTYNSNFSESTYPCMLIDNSGYLWDSFVTPSNRMWDYIAALLYFSEITEGGAIDGIGTQTGAILPDTSSWSDIPSTASYLRSAYPSAYNDALQYDTLQPDGSVKTKTYIPIPLAQNTTSPDESTSNDPWNNPQPTSDGGNQNKSLIDILTEPENFLKDIIKTITQTIMQPKTDIDNPTPSGTGTSSPLTPIAGSASALWSVYHPTKSAIDSFGAWLWTDNVIQQFIQLLNNPMEGIISLHKVFAPPVDSGSATIVVGRLDSGVGSATVSQQYVTIDCGSVNIDEYFGNVFDYSPYTTISLYLPFIGFVPLNPDDVMRATISVSYGVDVFTGACLAIVNVSRDGNNVGMYQYSGVASVEYPLTGAQHSGLISGLLGVAGGVAGVALASTGMGAVAGAGSIAGGLANFAKSNPARSGGFSGNAGAMGVKIPYIIIERPITKVAYNFENLNGYPTNYNVRLGDCSGNVIVRYVHVSGINATENELEQIDSLLKSGVIV